MSSNCPGIWSQRLGHKKTKINICHHMLTSSTQLQNRLFHVVERTRTSTKCQKMKNARAKRAQILFFIVKYANLWGFCCRRRRGCLSSLFITLIIICETEIRGINTSLAIQCMQACTQGCYKTINTDFKRNNTPFVLNISQRSSEGRTGPPTHPDQIRVGQNAATLSQAVPAWLRPLSNIISHTLFQLSMNRVLWNRLLLIGLNHCQICKFVGFLLPSSSWLLKLPTNRSQPLKSQSPLFFSILEEK